MLEQFFLYALLPLIIYVVGFMISLPFNIFMVRKNRDSTEAVMGDGKFQFTLKECVIISFLWPLCVVGLVILTAAAIWRFLLNLLPPYRKANQG